MRRGWRQRRWVRLVAGALVGAATGAVVFFATQLTNRILFVLTGTISGLLAAFLAQSYSRNARLSDVKVRIPQLTELHFVMTRDTQLVAWKIFVETATRVSTQSLRPGEGILREALSSLYAMF